MTGGDLQARNAWLADKGPGRDLNGHQVPRVACREDSEL